MTLANYSDEQLLSGLDAICATSHQLLARLIAYLMEVEKRGLHQKAAYCSMFDFCKRRLGLSNGATFRRLNASRLARSFPVILERLERGDVHLEALVALRDHLTAANVVELLDAVAHKSSQQVEKLVAARFPKPDVPDMIRQLPTRSPAETLEAGITRPRSEPLTPAHLFALDPTSAAGGSSVPFSVTSAVPMPTSTPRTMSTTANGAPVPTISTSTATARRGRITPRSANRHAITLTVSTEIREQFEHAQDLMRHRNPNGDLEKIVGEAMTLLITALKKERLAMTSRPQKPVRPCKPGYIPSATRRAVFERDGERCTYVSDVGDRCPATGHLEIHHIKPKGRGGNEDVGNLCVRCRSHNLMHAKDDFGRAHVENKIDVRRRKSKRGTPERPCAPPSQP